MMSAQAQVIFDSNKHGLPADVLPEVKSKYIAAAKSRGIIILRYRFPAHQKFL